MRLLKTLRLGILSTRTSISDDSCRLCTPEQWLVLYLAAQPSFLTLAITDGKNPYSPFVHMYTNTYQLQRVQACDPCLPLCESARQVPFATWLYSTYVHTFIDLAQAHTPAPNLLRCTFRGRATCLMHLGLILYIRSCNRRRSIWLDRMHGRLSILIVNSLRVKEISV